jgi:hypothetical protein
VKGKTSRREKLPPASDQMKAWSAALASEVAQWPRATARSFFGFNALYRGDNIFGLLSRTRSFGNGSLLAFRVDEATERLKARLQRDPRIGSIDQNNTRWFTFELSSDADLHEALDWLGAAYQAASKRRKSK